MESQAEGVSADQGGEEEESWKYNFKEDQVSKGSAARSRVCLQLLSSEALQEVSDNHLGEHARQNI